MLCGGGGTHNWLDVDNEVSSLAMVIWDSLPNHLSRSSLLLMSRRILFILCSPEKQQHTTLEHTLTWVHVTIWHIFTDLFDSFVYFAGINFANLSIWITFTCVHLSANKLFCDFTLIRKNNTHENMSLLHTCYICMYMHVQVLNSQWLFPIQPTHSDAHAHTYKYCQAPKAE